MKSIKLENKSSCTWIVAEDYEYNGIVVPKGFETDLDSIPRIPFIYAITKGRAVRAAVIHDFLYRCSDYSRNNCDKIFKKAMKDEGVPYIYRKMIFYAVRVFGGFFRY